MNARVLMLLILIAAVVASATAVVYSTHRSRALFAQLQALHRERDRLNVEWERLQLEQGAWTTHGRIERLARKELDMHSPARQDVILVRGVEMPRIDLDWRGDSRAEGNTHGR